MITAVLLAGLLTGAQPIDAALPRRPWTNEQRADALYWACGAADMLSTNAALNSGYAEANPLAQGDTNGEVLAKLAALKLGAWAILKLTKAPPWVYRVGGVAQCVAAGWNTGLVLKR
jgi:hypothetical protein